MGFHLGLPNKIQNCILHCTIGVVSVVAAILAIKRCILSAVVLGLLSCLLAIVGIISIATVRGYDAERGQALGTNLGTTFLIAFAFTAACSVAWKKYRNN